MADLWKPVKGVTIKETKAGQFLFHFAHPLDMEAVLNGGPWSFDNNMLILEQVQLGMQIEQIPLHHINMWVQVHNLPTRLMKEKFGIPLANYIGSFVEYDKNNNSSFWRQYMRLRVRIDVRLPLKKDTKVKDKEGKWCSVKFKYEKLGIFCFVCGIMGHAENKCEVRFSMEQDDGVREWSAEIRAENRRQGGKFTSRWLREDGGGQTAARGGVGSRQSYTSAGSTSLDPNSDDLATNSPSVVNNGALPNQQAIIGRQDKLLPINSLAHTSSHRSKNNNSNNNQFIPTLTSHTSPINSITVPPFLINNLSNPISIPNIHSTLNNNQLTSLIIDRPAADNNNSYSLPNQTLTFNSQSLPQAPQPTKKPLNRTPRTSVLKGAATRTAPQPTTHPALTRTRPEKKQKIPTLNPNPTQNNLDPFSTQKCLEDMEERIEKKRRREEEDDDTTEKLKEFEHFLTAGPGSQACRDQ
jgi:hypothetical protein